MPLYVYICPACGFVEETACPYEGIEAEILCPHCNSKMKQELEYKEDE